MKYSLFLLFVAVGLSFTSCTEKTVDVNDLVAEGGKKYGGEFKFMSVEKVASLLPVSSSDHYSSRMVSQIHESLLRLDPATMEVLPAIAESFKISEDGTVYTFKIRKGINFHNDECFGNKPHELDAEDVKFSLDYACSGLEENQVRYLIGNKIQGADEFYNKSDKSLPKEGVKGIKTIDKHTLEIKLNTPFSGFETILAHSSLGVFPREAFEKYGTDLGIHPVGSGPFKLESISDEKIVLTRNGDYWRKDEFGNQLPYLGKVIMTYTHDKRSELLAFRKSEVDLVLEIPVEEIEHILGTLKEAQEGKNVKHKVESELSMSMRYLAMNCESDEFKDARVRKAFNIAINRDEIIDSWLEGEGWSAKNGFVPEMNNYPNEQVNGHKYNVALAQKLMSDAGFSNGKNFPAIELYVNAVEGSKAHRLCSAITKQLKQNINVDVNIKLCTIEERQAAIKNGTAKMWRAGWLADYPDPENFLAMFYSGNIEGTSGMENRFHFKSDEFNSIYEQVIAEADPIKRTELMVQCDQLIIDESPLMPIYTDDNLVMINARVRDFKANVMESLILTNVFIKEPKKN